MYLDKWLAVGKSLVLWPRYENLDRVARLEGEKRVAHLLSMVEVVLQTFWGYFAPVRLFIRTQQEVIFLLCGQFENVTQLMALGLNFT